MNSIATAISVPRFRVEQDGEAWRVIRNVDDGIVGRAPTELAAFREIVRLLEEETLAAGYRALAEDEDSEQEAQSWMSAPLGSPAA
jgi:hypothetical protein